MKPLSFKRFKKNIKQETYKRCHQIMIKNNYSNSEAEHVAHKYADAITGYDAVMVTDMYMKYTSGEYTLEEATRAALNILTHLFCVNHDFDPENKDYLFTFLEDGPSPHYLYLSFKDLGKVKEMWKRYFQ